MAAEKNKQKSVQELETPKVDLRVDMTAVDHDPKKQRPRGREYPKSRSSMPED
jgi:hypothetical protein